MPNRSMVVIQLRTLDDLAEFAEAYNGRAFNSMEVSQRLSVQKLQN
jgi:BRCA1-associated protein